MRPANRFLTGAVIVLLTIGGLTVTRAEAGPAGVAGGQSTFIEKLTTLGVTAEQQTAITEILRDHQPELDPLRRRFVAERRALRELIYADQPEDSAIRNQARQVGRVGADLAVARAHLGQEIRGVLTPAQVDQLRELRAVADDRVAEFLDRIANRLGEE
ncbi:Spy/CpxP family protein refolding chaperone [bacterium]|nr:Spy/CpxP family protein refolding chaperone [bacterium]